MKKAVKGTYGYLKKKRNQVIIRTIIFFATSLTLFAAGYATTHTQKNLLTIVAVLGCLPACKSLVNMIMYFRASGCSVSAYEKIREAEGHLIGMFDMYFTSYQKNYAISHMVAENQIILAYTENSDCDILACREHLETMLKQAGYKGVTITVNNDLSRYCEQLKSLNDKNQISSPIIDDEVRAALYDISL